MAGASELRELRQRINSVESTKQITRAMEMIAASRIQRAIRRMEAARPYAELIHEILRGLMASAAVEDHPLLAPHDSIDRVAICVMTSDRGLAGAYNANVLQRSDQLIGREADDNDNDIALFVTGSKGVRFYAFRDRPVEEAWTGFSEQPQIEDAAPIADTLMRGYANEDFDRVWVVYTDFQSRIRQVPNAMQILPVDVEELEGGEELPAEFMFEPDPEDILDRLIPSYVEAKVYAALLESAASEHAMRQRAMSQATDNAEEMIDDLSRDLNQARQSAITQEVSEIAAGAEALAE
ncbi:MAG: F0F1 ATP synthase subunit gamma [Actinobacteria bacterium]|nr:F0F1 ATP synthase subunit gamma [Actinomycetota bacterium]